MSVKRLKLNIMPQEEILKSKYGTDTGYRVPEGYFDELNSKILADLPPYKMAPKTVPMSMWQRVKPYVYLAAMFAGIWMMMKVFHTVSTADRLTLDNPPEAIAQMMDADSFDDMFFYSLSDAVSDLRLEEEVSENYDSMEDFEADFGYQLRPEYRSMAVTDTRDDYRHS